MPRGVAFYALELEDRRRAFPVGRILKSTANGSPFGSNGDDRRQWRKQGGAVGAAASRMRAAAKQTLGAATRAPFSYAVLFHALPV